MNDFIITGRQRISPWTLPSAGCCVQMQCCCCPLPNTLARVSFSTHTRNTQDSCNLVGKPACACRRPLFFCLLPVARSSSCSSIIVRDVRTQAQHIAACSEAETHRSRQTAPGRITHYTVSHTSYVLVQLRTGCSRILLPSLRRDLRSSVHLA